MKRYIVFAAIFFILASSALADGLPVLKTKNDLAAVAKKYSGKTLVVFWAPWCPHCLRELRMLRDNPQFIKKNHIQIIGMVKEADADSAVSTIKDEKFRFRFYTGTQELYTDMMKIDAVPFTVVMGRNGAVTDFEYGEQKLDELELMLK